MHRTGPLTLLASSLVIASCGEDKPKSDGAPAPTAGLVLTSPAFAYRADIPARHRITGENVSPPLEWSGAPAGTREFALIVDDPDTPSPPPAVHWVVCKIPADASSLPEAIPLGRQPGPPAPAGIVQGTSAAGTLGWSGPEHAGGGAHQIRFVLYALDAELSPPATLTRDSLLSLINGKVLAQYEYIGVCGD